MKHPIDIDVALPAFTIGSIAVTYRRGREHSYRTNENSFPAFSIYSPFVLLQANTRGYIGVLLSKAGFLLLRTLL